MRTDESLLASWLPRHRVLHLSGRNLLLGLLCGLAGLGLLGWCLYWLNNAKTYSYRSSHSAQDESDYLYAAQVLLPAGLGLLGLGLCRVLRFRLLLRLTQFLFALCLIGCALVWAFVLWLLALVIQLQPNNHADPLGKEDAWLLLKFVILPGVIASCCWTIIRKLQHWLRQTRA